MSDNNSLKSAASRPIADLTDAELQELKESNRKARDEKSALCPPEGMPVVKTALELLGREFEPLIFFVESLIVAGLTILAGAPKIGKSWMVLQLCVAIANGGRFMSILLCAHTEILLLALEDTDRRLQSRLKKQGSNSLYGFHYATEWPQGQKGINAIELFIMEHPDVKVVIIDTWARFQKIDDGNDYHQTTQALAEIKSLADRKNIAIILVHHTRKMASDDFIDSLLGSRGIPGTVDTIIVLSRDRYQGEARLSITSRDIEEREYALSFDSSVGSWTLLGDAAERQKTTQRQEIHDLLKNATEPMSPKMVHQVLKDRGDKRSPTTIKRLLWEMGNDGTLVSLSGFYTVMNHEPAEPKVHTVHKVHAVRQVQGVHKDEELPF